MPIEMAATEGGRRFHNSAYKPVRSTSSATFYFYWAKIGWYRKKKPFKITQNPSSGKLER